MRNYQHITIVGAGIIGLLCANLIVEEDLTIAIIDHQNMDLNTEKPTTARVSAITKASEKILSDIAIWQLLTDQQKTAFEKIHVFSEKDQELDFLAEHAFLLNLGYIVDNQALQNLLLARLKRYSNVQLYANTSVKKIIDTKTNYQLQLNNQEVIKTDLLIAADGANSSIRQQLQIPVNYYEDDHSALVSSITCSKAHLDTAYQRFFNQSILAFLPLPDKNQCSIVWSMPSALAEKMAKLSDIEFCQQLSDAFCHKLGTVIATTPRIIFPITMLHAKIYNSCRAVLIGDSAHVIHPLAGQGMNLGISDAACLASLIKEDKPMEIILRRYSQERYSDNASMLNNMRLIKALFSERSLLKPLLPLGLNMVQKSHWLKRKLVQEACGLKHI